MEPGIEAIDGAFRTASAAWPALPPPDDGFRAYLTERLDGEGTPEEQLARLPVADLFLAYRCGQGHAGALRAFEEAHFPSLAALGRKVGGDQALIDEVAQELRQSLFSGAGSIATYRGKGSLAGWFKVIATRAALRRAKREPDQGGGGGDQILEALPDSDSGPEMAYLKKRYGDEFRRAFERALDAMETRDRLLLKQQVVDRLSIDDIARLNHTHRATAARWLVAAREDLARRVREELKEELGAESATVESVLRLLDGELEISAHRLLRKPNRGPGGRPAPRPSKKEKG
jgi:RNA polymerase sigma-70 factor (ECF subfamily)